MRRHVAWTALVLVACGTAAPEPATPPRVVVEQPATIDPPIAVVQPVAPAPPASPAIRIPLDVEARIDGAVLSAIARRQVPGAVVAIGRRDGLVFLRAYGARATDPAREPNDVDTIYDLASVTKAVATATSIAILESRGVLAFDDPVARFLPAFAAHGKAGVTIRQLLTHTSGLPAVDPLSAYEGATREESIARILALAPDHPPGQAAVYSDLGFIVLGEVVAAASGVPLDRFVEDEILTPLAMRSSCYRCDASLLPRIAPTERAERRGGVLIRGDVHDPRAFRLGGVSGNAGLFASAPDLARFAQMMLRGGELDGAHILPAVTTLGWMTRTDAEQRAFRAAHGAAMSTSSFGHSGWTGTWLRIDPELDAFAIVLSNDVHPDAHGDVRPLSAAVESIVAESASRFLPPPAIDVLAGIDVELRDGLPHLDGARVVLVTHDAARARDGRRTLDVLASSPGVSLVRVLAPEHGIASDREGAVRDGVDARTSLPVLGLFGPTRTPTDAMLEGADTIVIDLVDVGVRFYTYASTMHQVLVAAAARPSLRVVLLDRPDPLGGAIVEGPALDADAITFINHHALPLRHGMTLGELARLLDAELALGLGERLVVVRAEGWQRAATALDVAARWAPPSPNLPDAETALLYPAVALLEGADVSVGRGTGEPFRVVGAPWMDADRVLASLMGEQLPGVAFERADFTPRSATHARHLCHGVRVRLIDRALYRASRTGLAIVRAAMAAHADHVELDRVLPLLGSRRVLDALARTEPLAGVMALADEDAAAFAERRAPFLLYP
jgi:uncharacterized protein YbbC (DUF1343 family)